MTPDGGLAELARAVLGTNPFRANRVSHPDDVRVDVAPIHGAAFRKLVRRVEEARERGSAGVMLTGIAGCGKSHLIARLYRWALEQRTVVPVFLHNLQASPERIGRYVLKATVSSVLRLGEAGDVLGGLARACAREVPRGTDRLDAEIHGVLRALLQMVGDADEADLLDAAVAWLSGEELDEDQAAFLHARAGVHIRSVLPDAASVERVLLVLARLLAAEGRVLLLCLDQIDNLDGELVAALAAFLHGLLDHADHLVVICSGVTATIAELRRSAISEAAWDRIAEHEIALEEIGADQARMLVVGRLDAFFAAHPAPALARAADPLRPLGAAWFAERFTGLQFRPRDVISRARDAWEQLQIDLEARGVSAWLATPASPPAPPAAIQSLDDAVRDLVRAKVEERRTERLLNPASLPPDADNLATLIRGLLTLCAGFPAYTLLRVDDAPRSRAFDLIVRERSPDGAPTATGVLCLPGGHGNTTTAALRRAEAERAGLDQVVVATDARRPFKPGAKGKEYLASLEAAGGFRLIALDLDQVVALDALVSVLGLARVGDLEVEHGGRVVPVSEAQAEQAMHTLDLFRAHPLLRELLTEGVAPPPPAPPEDPEAVLRREIAAHLAWRAGAMASEIARRIAADPPQDAAVVLVQVVRVAEDMHRAGVICVTPAEDDRYLLWIGEGAA